MWPVFKKKKSFSPFSHKYPPPEVYALCLVSAFSCFFFFLLYFFLSLLLSISFLLSLSLFLSLFRENLLLWQSAIHSESLTKQSSQFFISNKLIFVHAVLLRKEGQFYAGFYGLQHKDIYLHASYLAGSQQTMRSSILAIASCNEEL